MTNSELCVMTFNVRNSRAGDGPNSWEHRRAFAADLIRTQNADVVGIQEAFQEQVTDLLAALPEYAGIGVGREDGRSDGEYALILYRKNHLRVQDQGTFWFSDTPQAPGSRSWGNRCTRICTWAHLADQRSGRSFRLYNLHIDHESQPSRERSIEMLLERVRQQDGMGPAIVTGDFNAGESNPILHRLAGSANPTLRDTFRAVHPDEHPAATYHEFRGGTSGEKIDYIFASPEFETRDAAILRDSREGRFPSDHYPVVALLAWLPPSSESQ